MKYLVISDIHGDYDALKEVIGKELANIDMILCLGDLFSFDREANEKIINLFTLLKDKLILIKGNCDPASFGSTSPLKSYYSYEIADDKGVIFLTHGDRFYDAKPYVIYLFGHTHIPEIYVEDNCMFINPGSLGRPRGASNASYAILSDEDVKIFDILGALIMSSLRS